MELLNYGIIEFWQVKQAAQLVRSNQPTVALNLSRTPAPSIEKCPTSTATTFQELSAKLEQYFSTGIAASKFPRKMVRGQDMWMQDIEQKRRILKCLKCGCSYNTLGELARHIKKSGHHNEAPLLATEASSAEPIRSSAPRFGRQTMEKVASGNRNFLENPRTHQQEKISRGPSAFRPVQRSLVEPAARMEASKKIEFRGNFSQSATRSTDKEDGFLKNVDLDRSFLQEKFRKNSQIGQSGFFHGVAVLPTGAPLRSDFSFGEKGSSGARNGLGRTVGRLPATRPARAASSPKSPGISKMENESPKVHLPIKQELKMGSDQEQKEDARMLVTPSNFMMESSPLFALKKFLDFGIPRLKPTGIDGGRL
jgi:hypothetical protein